MIRFALATAVVLGLLRIVGMAGDDQMAIERAEVARYCDNVRSGVWPDFNRNFSSECR